MIDPRSRVLLLRYEETADARVSLLDDRRPAAPEPFAYWLLPGGGLLEGETFEAAAVREVEEETGIELRELGACIGAHEARLIRDGVPMVQHERYFVARISTFGTLRNRTDEPIRQWRWWSLIELRSSSEVFSPEGLAELIEPVLAGRPSPRP